MIAHTLASAAFFVIACVVCGYLGYGQGRRDEELVWRRVVGNLDKRTGDGGAK